MELKEDLLKNLYKKGTNKIDPAKILVTLLFIMMLVFIGLCNRSKRLHADEEREKSHRYTIGITGNIYNNLKSSTPNVKYNYEVDFIKYAGSESIYKHNEGNVVSNGGRYFVEFSSINPGNSKLLLDYPVPITIEKAPILGWDSMPKR
jgi:hypothetical protein